MTAGNSALPLQEYLKLFFDATHGAEITHTGTLSIGQWK